MQQGPPISPISQVSEIKSIQVEKITASPMVIEETKTVTTIIENNSEKKIENENTQSTLNEPLNNKAQEIPKEINKDINKIQLQENKDENKNKPIEETKAQITTNIIHSEINSNIIDNEPVFQTKIIKEIPNPIEKKQESNLIMNNQKDQKINQEIKPKGISKERIIPVGITNKSKVEMIDTPVEIIAEEKLNNKNNISTINKEKENEKEKLIPLNTLNTLNVINLNSENKENKDLNNLKEKLIPIELLESKESNKENKPLNNKMDIEEVPNKISISSKEKELPKNISQNSQKIISLDITKEIKEKTIPLNPKEIPKQIPNMNNMNIPLKEKEIPLPMKENPKEKIISLDFKEIIKNAELPARIKEAYNKMLEHPKKKVENELITEILEGKKEKTPEKQEKVERVERVEREKKGQDNRNVNNLISQILQEKTIYQVKNSELNRMNNLNNINNNMNINNNVNNISITNTSSTNYTREDRREKRDKRINRNEQILDILQGKLINIPSDNKVETIYEDRNDNIFKKKIGTNVQRLFDRKVVNNNNNFNNINYNPNMTMIDNNNRYINIPGNYTNAEPNPNRMNYPRNYPNIPNIQNIVPENPNNKILMEKMDKVEIIEEKDEIEKYPKNLQITEYPRMPTRMVRKEQKRTEINILDPSLNKNEEIHILDTVNRNIDLFPHAQMTQMQAPLPIPQKNLEVEKNEEKIKKKDEYDFLKQFGKQKDDNSKELLDLIQTVIEDDPNQIKMFQQKIKDDEIKSGKKMETPIEEEEDEADLKAIENYKKKVQYNVAEFRKNRKPLNINKLLDNKKKNISIAEKRFNLMKDNALNKLNNLTSSAPDTQEGVIELLDVQEPPLKGARGRGRKKRGAEKKN